MFIDTHCHICKDNAKEYVDNAINADVHIMINASEDFKSSLENISLLDKFSNLFGCVGVHPLNVKEYDENTFLEFEKIIKHKKVKAIGEIGLDYYYSKDDKELQQKVFRQFLKLAEDNNLPVVIHSREATKDTLDILKEYNVVGVIHCFSGSLEVAREYIKMGFYLGVGGVLTFKNSKLFEVIKEVPLEYIVLETDAPFLTPEPYRKFKNESKFIPVIARKLADYKGINLECVRDITTKNGLLIFDIDVNNMI